MPNSKRKMTGEESSFEDLLNQSEVKDFLHRAERDMFPKMKGSVMSLVINSEKPDIKLALEVGAAILFDKPLIIVSQPGNVVPRRLREIAEAVIEDADFSTPEAQAKVKQAIEAVLKAKGLL